MNDFFVLAIACFYLLYLTYWVGGAGTRHAWVGLRDWWVDQRTDDVAVLGGFIEKRKNMPLTQIFRQRGGTQMMSAKVCCWPVSHINQSARIQYAFSPPALDTHPERRSLIPAQERREKDTRVTN